MSPALSRQLLRFYLPALGVLVAGWLALNWREVFAHGGSTAALCGASALYLASHLLRLLRLALLTLDQRDKAGALMAAHLLTAFPSSFLPFKIGEILRLTAFCQVYPSKSKAFAVWLAERFGDVLIVAMFISGLYLFDVELPGSMRLVFVLFLLASVIGLLGLFAVAKTLVYFNRHLVLTSHSPRGLRLLKASAALRRLEVEIHCSVEGRLSAFLLLSSLIWALEIGALVLFTNFLADGDPGLGTMFAEGLLSSLPGGGGSTGLYQSLVLVALSLLCMGAIYFASRMRKLTS